MSIFNKQYTTESLHIGTPEAEAEVNIKSRVNLNEVFHDYLDVIPEIETEKFIVVGRKGSGKTAIGQMLFQQSKSSPNKFCDFIRADDIDIETLVQQSQETDNTIQHELLFKWLILTRMLNLIIQNEAVQHFKQIKQLKEFLKKNSGYVQIDKYEIKEIVKTSGFEIFIEHLSRFFRGSKNTEFKLTGSKAPFYKLIPYLEEAIKTVLLDELENSNQYLLIFDDLDVNFQASNDVSITTILNLIRIARHYNNNFFSQNNIDAKVILLLRDDIGEVLIKRSADMAKIFSSYAVHLRWYEHELYKIDENLLKLKKFINTRIKHAFKKADIPITSTNCWNNLIDADKVVNETSFKYLIDHTFYSPRDLILLFKPLHSYNFRLPLNFNNLNTLIGRYAQEVKFEIDNALAIYLSPIEIKRVWEILQKTSTYESFSYDTLIETIKEHEFSYEPAIIATILYDYSLIGNKLPNSKMVLFKYRENSNEHFNINPDYNFINHRIVAIKFQKNV